MNESHLRSSVLVGVQVACVVSLLVSGPWIAKQPAILVLEVLGGGLGIWALMNMKLRNFSVLPDVRHGSHLIMTGPYQWVRHPMYTALLLVMLSLVLDRFSFWRSLAWCLLLLDLLWKLQYEEVLLLRMFPEYRAYQNRTFRLVPGIF